MRIKEVCKQTNLTDKAIRLYINSNLISPSYQENYNGRKNYDFSQKDVEKLKCIAILRRYDFSIQSIKEMMENPNSIDLILDEQTELTKQTFAQSSMILTNLKNAQEQTLSSVEDLCQILSQNLEPNQFEIMDKIKDIWYKIKKKIPLLIVIITACVIVAILLLIAITFLLTKIFMMLS